MITEDTAVVLVVKVPVGNLNSTDIAHRMEHVDKEMKMNHPNVELILLPTRSQEYNVEAIPLRMLIDGNAEPKITEEELTEFKRKLREAIEA